MRIENVYRELQGSQDIVLRKPEQGLTAGFSLFWEKEVSKMAEKILGILSAEVFLENGIIMGENVENF